MKYLLLIIAGLLAISCSTSDELPARSKDAAKKNGALFEKKDEKEVAKVETKPSLNSDETLTKLRDLNKAYDEGVITKDEFRKMRKRILEEKGIK